MTFKEKKIYFKSRQELYDKMKSITKSPKGQVYIDNDVFENSCEEFANYVFVWFDRKPFVAYYNNKKNYFWIGNQRFFLNSKKEKTKVIAFVNKINEHDN